MLTVLFNFLLYVTSGRCRVRGFTLRSFSIRSSLIITIMNPAKAPDISFTHFVEESIY